jgi:integrase
MEKMTKRTPTKFPGVYSRRGIHRKGKHKGKIDTVFDVSFKDSDGKKVWKKVGWQTEGISLKLAVQFRAEWTRKIRLGEGLPWKRKKVPLFSEMASLYLKWSDENKNESNDHSRYKHLEGPLGNKRLNEISSFDLEKLKSDLTKKELAPATIKHCLVLVREIYNKAVAWRKYQGPNPIRGVKLPTLNNRRERFLSHEEADLLLQKLAGVSPVVHDMALLSLHTGLRAGEVFNLRGQDLDFENRLIRVVDSKNKSNRSAYMTNTIKEMLQKCLPKNPGDFVFTERGNDNKVDRISQTFERAVDALGFNKDVEGPRQKAVFHTLRHTFASWLAIQGTPILTIKELLGHKSLTMTERYSHLAPDAKKGAALALEASFEASRAGNKVVPLAAAKQNPGNQ